MDNLTLLKTLVCITICNVIYTFIIAKNIGRHIATALRLSAIFIFLGFFLILTQAQLSAFFSIILANYLILIGSYYQVSATLCFEFNKNSIRRRYLAIISLIYMLSFYYFTYISFNTELRIILISAFLMFLYIYTVLQIYTYRKTSNNTAIVGELYYLFIIAAIFYAARILVTLLAAGSIDSLFDKNLFITLSLLFFIIFNLSFLVGMISALLRKKRHDIKNEKEKLHYLFDFLNDTAKHLELEKLYPSIEEVLRKSLGIETAAIFLKDNHADTHSIAYIFNGLNLPIDNVKTLKNGEGASGKAIAEDKVINIEVDNYDITATIDQYKAKGVTNLVSAPIKTSTGIIGAITVIYTKEVKSHQFLDSEFFYYMGEQIGLVIQNALLYEQLSQLANTDPMTGLLNRRKMQKMFALELKRATRNNLPITLALVDIDHFKQVNDSFGHECGDIVLKNAAKIFQESCRETDHICRWGGEEFLLLFVDTDIANAHSVSERIRSSFAKKKQTCRDDFFVTLSVGLTQYTQDQSMENLIKKADQALYQAKENGRNQIRVK